MFDREMRAGLNPVEVRAKDDGTVRVEGYAAVFEQETNIADLFREKIARGAFTDAIGRDDVVFLINHDGLPMARTKSGTLEIRQDATGLWIGADLDAEDPDVKRIIPKMKRGDLDKMSFAFRAKKQEWDENQDPPVRTILQADLYDVSIVTTPAYEGTSIAMRSLDDARKERRIKNFNAAAARVRNRNKIALAGK
jgi:HK97 family phage prohead protease